ALELLDAISSEAKLAAAFADFLDILLHGNSQRFWDALGLTAGDKGDPHFGLDKKIGSASALLQQRNGRALHFLRDRNDVEHVIDKCWLEIVDHHRAHHKSEAGSLALCFLE